LAKTIGGSQGRKLCNFEQILSWTGCIVDEVALSFIEAIGSSVASLLLLERGCDCPQSFRLQFRDNRERWLQLSEMASAEQEPVKFLELSAEIKKLLLGKEERLIKGEVCD
jgi:hypothetical protein